MTRAARALLLLLAAGCSAPPAATPQERPAADEVATVPVPPVQPPAPAPAAGDAVLLRATLPNGLSTIALRFHDAPPAMAEILFGVLAGTDQGKQGVADLATWLLLASADATTGRPDLRQAVARLGGSLSVEHGLLTTWFTLRVPPDRWQQALAALAAALQQPALGRTQLERLQQQLLQERAAAVARAPAVEAGRRLLLGDRGTGEHLAALQERDPGEAVLFLARNYRPDHGVLALRVPGAATDIANAVVAAVGGWSPPAVAPDPFAGPHERRLRSGLYWAPGPGDCRVALVLALPPPPLAEAPPAFALLNCLSLEGVGGRFERLLQERGLGQLEFAPQFLSCGEAAALVLSTTATAVEIGPLWRTLQDARRSLADLPPTPSEQALARARARLMLRSIDAEAATGLRMLTSRLLTGVDEQKLQQRLDDLDQPEAFGPANAAAFTQLPAALVVVGGAPPAELADVQRFDLLPPGILAQLPGAGAQGLVAAAVPWLEKAVEAAGGKDRIARLAGYQSTASVAADGAPAAEETLEYRAAGALRCARTLLDSTIETVIEGNSWVEKAGAQQTQLTPQQAGWRLAEARRHPLALLNAFACGKLQFRLLADREFEERDHLLLEAVGERSDRLRVLIDRESGLLRAVETWCTTPEGNPTYILDTWSDHRTVEGLRVPFRRETVVDDGQSRRVTTFQGFRPLWK